MSSNDASGPFKPLRLLWFPFALPAIALGTAAWILFWAANALLAAVFDEVHGAEHAVALFFRNLESSIFGLGLAPISGSGWLFLAQVLAGLALWSTFGLAISRVLALRLAREEYLGYRKALAFGFKHAPAAWTYALIVGITLALLLLVPGLIGALIQIPAVGVVFTLLLPIAWVAALLALIVTLSGLFGLGMVAGAIAVERRGALDAWGKALNYLFARPLHVIVYLVLLEVVVVEILIRYLFQVDVLDRWVATSMTTIVDTESFAAISRPGSPFTPDGFAQAVYRVFASLAHVLMAGFVISCLFAGFVGMFLVLRHDVDGIDTAEIDLDEPVDDPAPTPIP